MMSSITSSSSFLRMTILFMLACVGLFQIKLLLVWDEQQHQHQQLLLPDSWKNNLTLLSNISSSSFVEEEPRKSNSSDSSKQQQQQQQTSPPPSVWIPPKDDNETTNPLEQLLIKSACNRTSSWCGIDGSECGLDTTTSSYDQHKRLKDLIFSGVHIKAIIFGNSVARSRLFATTRFLFQSIKQILGNHNITTNYGRVKGGFELRHLLQCGGFEQHIAKNNLAIFQYDHYYSHEMEVVLRLLLSLPSQPAIIVISHCHMGDFSTRDDWRNHPDAYKIGEPFGFWEEMRRNETELMEYYGIPYIRTCPAFFHMFNRTEEEEVTTGLQRLKSANHLRRNFIGDLVHYNEDGSSLQSCFLSRLISLNIPQNQKKPIFSGNYYYGSGKLPVSLPDPIIPSTVNDNDPDSTALSKFCMSVSDRGFKPIYKKGWEEMKGGAGGQKVWYGATHGYNSTLALHVPFADFLQVMVYTHPDLPLGRVQVHVSNIGDDNDREVEQEEEAKYYYIDPCCEGKVCPGTHEGRGIYKEFRIPSEGYLRRQLPSNSTQLEVRLVIVPRTEPTKCSQDGTDFSFVGVTGHSLAN